MGIQAMIPRHGFYITVDGYMIVVRELEWKTDSRLSFHCETIPHPAARTLSGHPHIYRGKMLWRVCRDKLTLALHPSASYEITLNVSWS